MDAAAAQGQPVFGAASDAARVFVMLPKLMCRAFFLCVCVCVCVCVCGVCVCVCVCVCV